MGSRSGLKPVDFAMLPGVDGTEEIEIEDADSEIARNMSSIIAKKS